MNFCYIFTIFCAIFLIALIFVNSIEAYVARLNSQRSIQKLNEFRLENQKVKEVFPKFLNKFHENKNYVKRKRRQTEEDTLDNIAQNMDQEKMDLEPEAVDYDTDFSKRVQLPEQIIQSLQSSDQQKNSLNSLNLESIKRCREIASLGNEPNMMEPSEEDNESIIENREKLGLSESFKGKFSHGKEQSKFRNQNNYQNLNQKLNLYQSFLKDDQLVNPKQTAGCSSSDLSSCQHCSQHVEAGALMNRYDKNKNDLKSNNKNQMMEIDSKSKDLTNNLGNNKKFHGKQTSNQSFGTKFSLKNQENDDNDDEDDDEEEDLFELNNPAAVLKAPKQEAENRNISFYNNYKLSSPNKNSENFNLTKTTSSWKSSQPLNDQLDNRKNNLSHEANYKLSKTEQDASEKAKKDFSWKWGIFKRSQQFNAMNEIKLKTSSRLMKKGFGASLPSYSLGETRKELKIADTLRKKEKQLLLEKMGKCDLENMESFKDTFEGNGVMDSYKQLDDFVIEPMESASGSMGQKYRSYIRKKRISDGNKRFKREIREGSIKKLNEINVNLEKLKERKAKVENPNDYPKSQRSVNDINDKDLKLDATLKRRNGNKSDRANKNSSEKCSAVDLKAYIDINQRFVDKSNIVEKSFPKVIHSKNSSESFYDKIQENLNTAHESSLNKSLTESSKKSFSPKKLLKRVIVTYIRELNKKDLHTESKKFDKTLKRSKRSIKTNHQENGLIKSDVNKNLKKRKYSYFDNLYKPEYNLDYPNTKQINFNPENDFTNSRQIFNNDEVQHNENGNFDFAFDREKFENLKDTDLQLQKFGDIKFDNLWHEDKSHKYEKRLIKPKNLRNHHQKPHVKRQNLATGKTNITDLALQQLKSDDFPLKVQLLKDKYLNDLQNFNQNYKFNENHFIWPQPNLKNYNEPKDNSTEILTTTEDSHNLSLELRNEILNCKAFASLEDFLKSLPQNITNSLLNPKTESSGYTPSTEKIEMDINTPIISEITTISPPTVLDSTIYCSTTEELETSTEVPEDITQPTEVDYEEITECSEENLDVSSTDSIMESVTEDASNPTTCGTDNDVKLNISINANVHGNLKSNNFCGNGSFNFIPGLKDNDDDRRIRGVFSDPLESFQKRKCAEVPTQKPYDSEDNQDMNDLMSGKLSTNVVKTILKTVRESPELKVLWPSLKRNQPEEKSTESNFYVIRNQQNDNDLQNSEKLLAQVMSSINTIIEAQARSHACVPLRPDLQEFYNMILQSRREQDMVREKRQLKHFHKREDLSYKTHLIDPQKIEEEINRVQKLLKQNEDLPQENQKAVREDLLQNLSIFQEMQNKEGQKRKLRESENHVRDEDPIKSFHTHYSAQFLKLLKAAEFYRDISRE